MYPKYYLWKRIHDAKVLIDLHYAEPLNLDIIADRVHISKYHLIRLFKQAHGLTPRQYLISRRLGRAKQLLGRDLTITEVCHKVGFDSVQSFSLLFKNQTGCSPRAYRENVLKKATFDKS